MTGENTLRAGIFGWPVGHSLSPRLHGYWLQQCGIEGVYEPFAVKPAALGKELHALGTQGFRGVNLTIPHKEAALQYMDQIDEHAKRIGAVNTVIVRDDGALEGRNTDAFGFTESLRAAGFSLGEKKNSIAAILGAGGAARAVVAALQDMGFLRLRLVNRTRERAEQLAASMAYPGVSFELYDWTDAEKVLENARLLVNTTSLGMTGQPPLELNLSPLPTDAWVTDTVYAPLMTGLLKNAEQRGLRVVDGLGMLLHQARPAFKAFYGVEPEVTDALRRYMAAPA
jgi:shikimate dehydrogenase